MFYFSLVLTGFFIYYFSSNFPLFKAVILSSNFEMLKFLVQIRIQQPEKFPSTEFQRNPMNNRIYSCRLGPPNSISYLKFQNSDLQFVLSDNRK